MLNKEFNSRRNKLLSQLDNNSIAIIFAASQCIRSGTEYYPYRQNSDFYYLTGFSEPDAIAVLIPNRKQGTFILFSHKKDPTKELWHGTYIGQKKAYHDFGAHQALALDAIDKKLPEILSKYKNIYSNLRSDPNLHQKVNLWLKPNHSKNKLLDLSDILDEMRLKKSQAELAIIRKAIDITAEGHIRAMKKCHPGIYEFELEAELRYEFNRRDGRFMAYEPIVAGGINACTLHYSKNDKKLRSGELVLIDAGVEYNYYSADVSRTFPINGKFTKEQQIIYEIVLSSQMEVIKMIRPGISWDQLQETANRIITRGLIDIGLLKGKIDNLLNKQNYKPFFMHKIGHWLGIDAHDVGTHYHNYFEPGMILTIEPGIYIASKNIGIRIEDDILVTQNGSEILTANIPKSITEIEKIMQ
ncbi:MAG: aminopeptidase P N-terminal domain-containing protein [Coxiellaceae bacterium]|jgi:Xaa-Pro aminopeptidase|nr:aminopeptidase P N-terminal domain-containing protein [Coxiellaceae bacterium]